jgi:hypothetical protein
MADNDNNSDLVTSVQEATKQPMPEKEARTKSKSSISPTSNIADVIQRTKSLEQQEQADITRATDDYEKRLTEDNALTEKARKGVNASNIPPQPQKEAYDAVQSFGSLGAIFGIMASAFTKTPMTSAMNAAAAAMNAVKANKDEEYKQAYSAWKDSVQIALDRHKEQQEAYNNALEKMKTDATIGSSLIRNLAAKYNDPAMMMYNEAGMWDKLENLHLARERAAVGMAAAMPKIEEWNLKKQALMSDPDWQSKEPNRMALASARWLQTGRAAMQQQLQNPNAILSGSDLDYEAEKYRRTGKMPQLGLGSAGSAGQNRANIIKRANELATIEMRGDIVPQGALTGDYDLGGQYARAADKTSLSNLTKIADSAISYEETASRNFDLALKLAPGSIPSDWGPWINKWAESGETAFGGENVPSYVTALLTGANEYAKVMSGATGAQGATVDARREAAERFSPYLSTGQIKGVIDVAKKDMDNRKDALTSQLDLIKGRISGEKTYKSDFDGQNKSTGESVPEGLPSGSKKVGTYNGKPVWESPEGKRFVEE